VTTGEQIVGKFKMGMAAAETVGIEESSDRSLDFHIPTVLF
jgi:hypothetical protein